MNYDFYCNCCEGSALDKRFSLWIASWTRSIPIPVKMWQFGGETNVIRSNTVAGVVCDQDYCYRDYAKDIKAAGMNGHEKDKKTIRAGVGVRILAGAKYQSGKTVPIEIRKKWWYVKYINANKGTACLDWSVDGKLRLFAEIDLKHLERYPE